MKTTTSNYLCLAALALVATTSTTNQVQASRLGGGGDDGLVLVEDVGFSEESPPIDEQHHHHYHHKYVTRGLQSSTDVLLKALVDSFMPALADTIEGEIADDLDPVILDYQTQSDQGAVDLVLNDTFCGDTSATGMIQYEVANMTGMSSMNIERLELQQGSQDLEIPFSLGFFGGEAKATWSGIWELEAAFDQFVAPTTATLETTFCGNVTFDEVRRGTAIVEAPRVIMIALLEGTTGNIFDFTSTTTLEQVTIQSMSASHNGTSADLGRFVDMATVDAEIPLQDIFDVGFSPGGDILEFVLSTLQSEINTNLPFQV